MSVDRSYLKVGETVSGQSFEVSVLHIKGSNANAPKVYIQSSMHGAELQGNAVIYQLLQHFEKHAPLGDITIVPHCNPMGGNHKVGEYTQGRFDPVTGNNWNRNYHHPDRTWINKFAEQHLNATKAEIIQAFKSDWLKQLEAALAEPWKLSRGHLMSYRLQTLATQADIVLDLHTGSKAARYLYAPRYAEDSVHYFHQEFVLLMDNQFGGALDEASFCPWLCLEEALIALGHPEAKRPDFESFTVELGTQEQIDFDSAELTANGILSYLAFKHVIAAQWLNPPEIERHIVPSANLVSFYAPMGGLYRFIKQPGDIVKAGEVFAQCLRVAEHGQSDTLIDIEAPFDGYIVNAFDSAAIPMGIELVKLMRVHR